ncbi:unnamed protein product [Periconia digitata]|uniref:Rhodopsin domain-containing protein n=1 Tax=Periconia digitata TaxID=1303443 RepID=A0A9W4U1P2_9PLEO|nr:unnamed protein product [Periconia digitata]
MIPSLLVRAILSVSLTLYSFFPYSCFTHDPNPTSGYSCSSSTMHSIEVFLELGIGWMIIVFRIFARSRQLGITKLQIDDYLMVFAGCLYAGEVTCAYFVAEMTRQQRAANRPRATPRLFDRESAGKIFLAGWLTYTALIWTLKTCILLFYSRLTQNVHINNMRLRIRIGAFALAITFVSLVCVILLVCSPLQPEWQNGPHPGGTCRGSSANSNTYVMLVFNVLTDVYLMYLPIPVIWAAKLDLKRKFGLTALFAGAVVTAVFGFLRCISIVTSPGLEGASVAGLWSARESCTAVIVTNIPLIYPYVNQLRHSIKAAASRSGTGYGYGSYGNGSGAGKDAAHASSLSKSTRNKKRSLYAIPGDTVVDGNESVERIVQSPGLRSDRGDIEMGERFRRRSVDSLGIRVERSVQVHSSRVQGDGNDRW